MSESAEKNYHQLRYGTADGEIKFGHLHEDNVQSSVMLRDGKTWNHYITLDQSGKGHRKFGTISVSPGSFQVQAGEGFTEKEEGQPAIYMDAKKGDIVIRCPKGTLKIEAKNIEMKAHGEDNKNGYVTIEGNEKIKLDAPSISVTSEVSTKIFSEKNVEVIGRAILNLYGGLVDAADGATTNKGSKGGSTNEEQNKQ
jgi:hypothetical protein